MVIEVGVEVVIAIAVVVVVVVVVGKGKTCECQRTARYSFLRRFSDSSSKSMVYELYIGLSASHKSITRRCMMMMSPSLDSKSRDHDQR